MDASLVDELIQKNRAFRVETASGKIFDVPHADFVRFSPKRTALIITFLENVGSFTALVPLLTVTAVYFREDLSNV